MVLVRIHTQKVHPNFAENLGRQILGNTFSGPKKKEAVEGEVKRGEGEVVGE